MVKNRRKLITYLGIWLGSALFLFAFMVFQRGLPGSFGELAAWLGISMLTAPIWLAWEFSRGAKLLVLAFCLAGLFAIAIHNVFGVDHWIAFIIASVLMLVVYRTCEVSRPARSAVFAAVAAVVVFPIVYFAAPLEMGTRVVVAMGVAGLAAWAGWRAWPAMERWRPAAMSRSQRTARSHDEWRQGAAAARGEMSAEDFLRPRGDNR